MTQITPPDAHAVYPEPTTLEIRRLLPGPIERVWAYLTESELRRQWLASGEMKQSVGAACELVWRNDQLTNPPGKRPDGFGAEHTMTVEITALEPLRRLDITWGSTGGVSFRLEPQGTEVLLTVVHRRISERGVLLKVSIGWHSHLDTLASRLAGREPAPFWDGWAGLESEYGRRLPS